MASKKESPASIADGETVLKILARWQDGGCSLAAEVTGPDGNAKYQHEGRIASTLGKKFGKLLRSGGASKTNLTPKGLL